MIKVICTICRKELKQQGALIFSSPTDTGHVAKYHICRKCEPMLARFLFLEALVKHENSTNKK